MSNTASLETNKKKISKLIHAGYYQEACLKLGPLIQSNPEDAILYKLLGKTLFCANKMKEAALYLKKSFSLQVDQEVIALLAQALWSTRWVNQDTSKMSLDVLSTGLKYFPDSPKLLKTKAILYSNQNDNEKAKQIALKLYESDPHDYELVILLATIAEHEADFELATKYYEDHLIYSQGTKTELFIRLAQTKEFKSLDDPVLLMAKSALKKYAKSSAAEAKLCFALAQIYSKLKMPSEAFSYWRKANKKMSETAKYSFFQTENLLNSLKANLDPNFTYDQALLTPLKRVPVFIVSMPRSGSTLTEQILASHSQIDGIGETSSLENALAKHGFNRANTEIFPDFFKNLDIEKINAIREEYQTVAERFLESSKSYKPDAKYFIDKNLFSFNYIGLIKLIFPEAKIINLNRDPIAILWSCYNKRYTSDAMNFSYDFESLARYYKVYLDYIQFWDEFKADSFIKVNYEDLVNDFENKVQEILAYIGLELEEDCLNFQNNNRAVKTASLAQVRTGLNKSLSKSWHAYAKQLEPLIKKLEAYCPELSIERPN